MMYLIMGIICIVLGFVQVKDPNVYRRGIWKKTSIFQRSLSPEQYTKFVRASGIFSIIGGVIICSGVIVLLSLGIKI